MTPAQARRAYPLALARGHEWATWAQRECGHALLERAERAYYAGGPRKDLDAALRVADAHAVELLARLTVADLSALVRSSNQNPAVPGIAAPALDEAGAVVHTTASGRLSWRIRRDGAVYLTVYRPGPAPVLTATVTPRGVVRVDVRSLAYGERHVSALDEALADLGVRRERDLDPLPDGVLARVDVDADTQEVRRAWTDWRIAAREDVPPLPRAL